MQHADHFTRILNEKESFRKEKFLVNKSDNDTNIAKENIENSHQDPNDDIDEVSSDESKVQKTSKPQPEIN